MSSVPLSAGSRPGEAGKTGSQTPGIASSW